jgi:hypothetical protein
MKKYFYFLLLFSTLILFSCSKEDNIKTEKECDKGYNYEKSSNSCVDIDECLVNNGGCEQNCNNTIGTFECSCDNNLLLNDDKKTCNNCKEDSCRNHGECIDEVDSFTCQCSNGYDGPNCEDCADGFEFYALECIETPSFIELRNKDDYSINEPESFAIDSNNDIYLVGSTNDSFEGTTNLGGNDIFISKFNSNLELQWIKQLGTNSDENGSRIIIDKNDNIYIASKTWGVFEGTTSGNTDIILFKINTDGEILWKKQFVTDFGESVSDIAIDSLNNIYISGFELEYDEYENPISDTRKLIIMKFNNIGEELFKIKETIAGAKYSNNIAVDSNQNIYIGTTTNASLDDTVNIGQNDILIMKYDGEGNKLWNKQFGTEYYDDINSILIKNDEVYFTGYVNGGIDEFSPWGNGNVFLTKLDNNGDTIFTKYYNDDGQKQGTSIAISNNDEIYISGYEDGGYYRNMLLKKLDKNGEILWDKNPDTGFGDVIISIKFSKEGSLYAMGVRTDQVSYYSFLLKFNF